MGGIISECPGDFIGIGRYRYRCRFELQERWFAWPVKHQEDERS
jgi:hypothetical protein